MAAYLISFRDGHGSGGVLVRAADEAEAREKFMDCNPEGKIESVRRAA